MILDVHPMKLHNDVSNTRPQPSPDEPHTPCTGSQTSTAAETTLNLIHLDLKTLDLVCRPQLVLFDLVMQKANSLPAHTE